MILREERTAYLPVVLNPNEGDGSVGKLLDSLKQEHDVIVVSTVSSARLMGMLVRRDFHPERHFAQEMDEFVDTMVWRRGDAL